MLILIILATIIATMHMKILTYLFSVTFREFYAEPLFAKYLANRFQKPLSVNSEKILGWFLPYLTSLLFVIGFNLLLTYNFIALSCYSGLIFGGLVGCIEIVWWHLMYRITYAIDLDFKRYWGRLLLMYVAFGITVAFVYGLFLD